MPRPQPAAIRQRVPAPDAPSLPPSTEPLTLSLPKAAKRLGIGKTLMWKLVSDKDIPARRLNGRIRIRVADLVKFADSLPAA
jgi:excisionase family DNA binding protein